MPNIQIILLSQNEKIKNIKVLTSLNVTHRSFVVHLIHLNLNQKINYSKFLLLIF